MKKLFVVFALISFVVLPFTVKSQGNSNVFQGKNFKVEFNKQVLFFQEVSGMDMQAGTVTYREGNDVVTPRKLPGITKVANTTLKKGVLKNDLKNTAWSNQLNTSYIGTMELYLLDEAGKPLTHWTLKNAHVVKINCGDKNAALVPIETLEIAHSGTIRN